MKEKTFDPRCLELALYFLPDGIDGRLANELAYEIQTAIEDFISSHPEEAV